MQQMVNIMFTAHNNVGDEDVPRLAQYQGCHLQFVYLELPLIKPYSSP